ncbi:MAG: oxygenase MpaB family protein [Akkermansiaceae bacterium]|nr:oxygenase MpaB family protein [Akkermansiaceae bacterium]
MASFQKLFAKRFRALLCNNETGQVPWLGAVAEGEGPGFFMPDDAPWVIHADLATMAGGVRALLVQALHPGSLAGVKDHSRYKDDPLGRLAGTIQWLTVTTFASKEHLLKESERIKAMHKKVKGKYTDARAESKSYSAYHQDLLLWVHIAFTDSFLKCHQAYSSVPIPGGPDAYVKLWLESVKPLGLKEGPVNESELIDTLERFESELTVSEDTKEVIQWIYDAPLPGPARLVYKLLFQAAYLTLSERHQEMIGIRTLPAWMIQPATRVMLKCMKFMLGDEDPLQDAARERLARWEKTKSAAS